MTDYEKINDRFIDELKDVLTYVDLSKAATDPMEKQLLKDIAKEEHEHAEILKHILKKANKYECNEETHELEERGEKALAEI